MSFAPRAILLFAAFPSVGALKGAHTEMVNKTTEARRLFPSSPLLAPNATPGYYFDGSYFNAPPSGSYRMCFTVNDNGGTEYPYRCKLNDWLDDKIETTGTCKYQAACEEMCNQYDWCVGYSTNPPGWCQSFRWPSCTLVTSIGWCPPEFETQAGGGWWGPGPSATHPDQLRGQGASGINCAAKNYSTTSPPSPAPTSPPSPAPSPAPAAPVAARGDPHMTNLLGQRFDLMRPGAHVLAQVPRFAAPSHTLLEITADVERLGGACADMYIQAVNVTGRWVPHRYTYAVHRMPTRSEWQSAHEVQFKVVEGRTKTGITYLNVVVRHLHKVKQEVGGLLGVDDHTEASSRDPACGSKTMTL